MDLDKLPMEDPGLLEPQIGSDDMELEEEIEGEEVIEEEQSEEEVIEDEKGEQENPAERYYTSKDVSKIVQTRVGTMNKKIERMQTYKGVVEKLAEISGMTVDQLTSRLNSMSDQEQASILGISPQEVALRRAQNKTNSETAQINNLLQRQLAVQQLKSDPQYSDYDMYQEEISDLLDDNPKLTVQQAYILVKGELGIQTMKRDAEQRAVNRTLNSTNKRVVGSSGAASNSSAPKISPEIVSAARMAGMTPSEYLAYSQMSTLDDYQKYKSKK